MASQRHSPSLGAFTSHTTGARWLSRLRIGLLLAVAALTAELVYIACASPRLAVREVELRGDPRVVEQVRARISLPDRANIFRAPTRLLAEQVQTAPAVRKARVSRDFPRRLVVTVERREPIAVIRRGERAMLVDPEGIVFTLRDEWGWGLPELVGPHLAESAVGTHAASAEISSLLSVLRAFSTDPRLRMTRLTFGGKSDIEVVLDSGPVAQLGGPSQLAAKVRLFAAALEQLGADQIEYINLSDPQAAYWRPRRNTVSAPMR